MIKKNTDWWKFEDGRENTIKKKEKLRAKQIKLAILSSPAELTKFITFSIV